MITEKDMIPGVIKSLDEVKNCLDAARVVSNNIEELYDVMDDSDMLYYVQNSQRKHEPLLECDLTFIQFVNGNNEYELKPDSRIAKLERELLKHGLEITPNTDIKQLTETVKLLGIV